MRILSPDFLSSSSDLMGKSASQVYTPKNPVAFLQRGWVLSLFQEALKGQESPRQTKPKKGQFMNFSQGQSGTKVRCESCLFSQGTTPEFTKMGEIHELFVFALSLVWFAGATPERGTPQRGTSENGIDSAVKSALDMSIFIALSKAIPQGKRRTAPCAENTI